jgi:peptidylprolyl isomerase
MSRVIEKHPLLKRVLVPVLLAAVVLGAAAIAGCASTTAGGASKAGDTVNVTYTGYLDNGQIFDSNVGKAPLTFKLGDGSMIKGFDQGVTGMNVGETKNLTIPAELGYAYHPELVQDMERIGGLEQMNLTPGDVIRFTRPDGSAGSVRVLRVNQSWVTIDENHPLAGQTLHFTVTLDNIIRI